MINRNTFLHILFTLFLTCSCNHPPEPSFVDSSELSSTHELSTPPLSEPSLVTEKPQLISTLNGEYQRSIRLNGLVDDIENSTFYINDYIEFEKMEGLSETTQFHITTQCMEPNNQNKFTRKVVIPFKERVHLIELLPEEIFSYGNHWWIESETQDPTCSFNFKATNTSGDIHYFELPHLPIALFEHSWNLSLIDKSSPISEGKEATKEFPMLVMKNLSNYKLVSHSSSSIDQLKLICREREHLDFSVNNQQQYDLWGLQGWSEISSDSNLYQPCRFLSLKENEVIGISQSFPLVSPMEENSFAVQTIHSKPYRSETTDSEIPFLNARPLSAYSLLSDLMYPSVYTNYSLHEIYFDILGFKIKNLGKEPLKLLLPYTGKKMDTYLFFQYIGHTIRARSDLNLNQNSFKVYRKYFVHKEKKADLIMSRIGFDSIYGDRTIIDELHGGNQVVYKPRPTDSPDEIDIRTVYALVTVQPESELVLNFTLFSKNDTDLCLNKSVGNDKGEENQEVVGMILEGDPLTIYRVLDNSDLDSASRTIVQEYQWEKDPNGKTLPVKWDLWNTNLDNNSKTYSGTFFKNTCKAAKNNSFAKSTSNDPSWSIRLNTANHQLISIDKESPSLNSNDEEYLFHHKAKEKIKKEQERIAAAKRKKEIELARSAWMNDRTIPGQARR